LVGCWPFPAVITTSSSSWVESGKQTVLPVSMTESTQELEEVVITAGNGQQPTNEMALVSVQSFSIEQTSRYAASVADPARMALAYAGVSGGGDDLSNEIVIRGNSPRGLLWRLEGVEIPNPNHFGAMGNSGGGISMLSATTLTQSDFYTGAFPAEFGNALSGVFDLQMRAGNYEKRETSLKIGLLGLEASTEGPFKKGSRASYLINYRYSTLAALSAINLNPVGDILPKYQDVSFKVRIPTEKYGTFSLFGLGGINAAINDAERDSSIWDGFWDGADIRETQQMGFVGLSHRMLVGQQSYFKTVLLASSDRYQDRYSVLDPGRDYAADLFEKTDFINNTLRLSTLFNHKFSARHSFRAGVIGSYLNYSMEFNQREDRDITKPWINYVDGKGNTQFLQSYAQWKYRPTDQVTVLSGVHYNHMLLNNKGSLEPRISMQWQAAPRHRFSLATGIHSKMEHIGLYLIEEKVQDAPSIFSNENLGLSKAVHAVAGYQTQLAPGLNLKIETYYQHLYDIPEAIDSTNTFSLINAASIWDFRDSLQNSGTGRNMGVDLTLEKAFSNNYYFLLTGSLFDSKFTAPTDSVFNSIYNGRFNVTALGGKEFVMGKKRNKRLGINGKVIVAGGNRQTPIDLEASRQAGYTVRDLTRRFEDQLPTYGRFDLGISYQISLPKSSHKIQFDVQNVTNRQNVAREFFNSSTGEINSSTQTGFFPFLSYQILF
ncbi:MAG: TonB-dependent receptor, partial [Bacteroidota bacterium]